MTHLLIRVLGELSVSKGGELVSSFESDKVRALLAYLVVEVGRPHRREALAALLWPDSSERTAHHNLSQVLFNLRKVLGDHAAKPPYLQITREAIQFNRESDYSLDLEQFKAYYSAWEKKRGQENTDSSLLEAMAGLYGGKFLQEFYLKDSTEFEDWILVQRASVHQRFMSVLTALADVLEKRGDFQSAQRYCRRQLELDPWREEAHCQLIRLLALDGQRSAALAHYETCRNILAEEFGVEPSPKTRDLYEQIRTGKVKLQIEPAAQLPARSVQNLPLPLTPFLGRKKELAELDRMLATPPMPLHQPGWPGRYGQDAPGAAGSRKE